jgi:PPM family protein phosphatase
MTMTASADADADANRGPDEPSGGRVHVAARSDRGTVRAENEDSFGTYVESPSCALAIVADGVSGQAGGEVASQMAVEVVLRAFRESPLAWGPLRRIHRAAQQANIEIHDRALVVTELCRMSTTLTAAVVHDGILHAAHVGDSRLYLIRNGTIVQKTKDHTLAGERSRLGLGMRPKGHPDRSTLTRSLGRELIAAIDRITFPLAKGDVLLVCSDGLYNVLEDGELRELAEQCKEVVGRGDGEATAGDRACEALVRAANARGAPDNLTVALMHVTTETPAAPTGWRTVLDRLLGR